MRFGQNVLRMTRKERLVEFSWEAHCFPFLARISGRSDDFEKCAARFGQIAFLSVKVLKIVRLALNSPQIGKTVRF